jgi:hypothetical protein
VHFIPVLENSASSDAVDLCGGTLFTLSVAIADINNNGL